jgi:Domain of unknown function (DUF4421)
MPFWVKATLVLIFISVQVSAQDTTAKGDPYITKYDDHFLIKTFITNRQLNFTIGSPQRGSAVVYSPNVSALFGFGVVFKRLSLNFTFKLAQSEEVKTQKGQNQYLSLQLHSYGRRFFYDVYYQDYKGYYITNPNQVFNQWDSKILPQRPDIKILNIGTEVSYILNSKRFSYRADFVLDEKQNHSAGSPIFSASVYYLNIRADSSLIPFGSNIRIPESSYFRKGDFISIGLVPGYAYNFVVFKRLFLSLGISFFAGLNYQKYGLDKTNKEYVDVIYKLTARSAVGYNGKNFVIGATLTFDNQTLMIEKGQLGVINSNATVFIGYRWKTKFLQGKKLLPF